MTNTIESLRPTRSYRDAIWQLFKDGPTWDGNLISKEDRKALKVAGLVEQDGGWNWLTHSGVTLALELGMGREKSHV
jgi:hypothetical protein